MQAKQYALSKAMDYFELLKAALDDPNVRTHAFPMAADTLRAFRLFLHCVVVCSSVITERVGG
jgi:hypothetical protein